MTVGAEFRLLEQGSRQSTDRPQGIAYFVRDVGGQLADGGELLRLQQLELMALERLVGGL